MEPLVYIILLNFNSWADTIECLESLSKLEYPNYRVLIVDNASSDDSVSKIKKKFPEITMIINPENLGFAGGNNVGIRHVLQQGADYIFLLNNDTVIDPAAVTELVRAGEADPDIGVLGSLTYCYDRPDQVWFAGGWINWYTGRTGHLTEIPGSEPYDAEFISGCALMIKRNVIEEIGLLDEDFFLYFEDTDWCKRVLSKGYRLQMVPTSRVWHKVSASSGIRSPLWQYYTARNLLLFMAKHNTFPARQVFLGLYPIRFILKSLIILITGRQLLPSYLQGNTDFWKGALGKQSR